MNRLLAMNCSTALATAFLLAVAGISLGEARWPQGIESFESDAVPEGWTASGGRLAVTGDRFKSGAKSLLWTWSSPAATLSCSRPTDFSWATGFVHPRAGRCLAFWLYNERPAAKILRLELLNGDAVIGKCWHVLDFKGWRPLGAPYREVLTDPAQQVATGFRLIAPEGMPEGRLYLEYVAPTCADTLFADNQQPWVGRPEILNTTTPEKFVYSTHDLSQNRPWLPPLEPAERITAEQRKDMATVLRRCLHGDEVAGVHGALLRRLSWKADPNILAEFQATYKLHRSADGVLTGAPVIAGATWGNRTFNAPADGVPGGSFVVPVPGTDGRREEGPFLRLVEAYLYEKEHKHKEQAAKLLSACLDMFEHLLDQGYAEGNNNIGCNGFDFRCVTELREELETTKWWRDLLLACANCTLYLGNDLLVKEDWGKAGYFCRNTDASYQYHDLLAFIALLPDEAERLQRLYALSQAIERLCDPSLGEPFAWDGTAHHHAKFHIAYTGDVLLAQIYPLRGTVFQVSPEVQAIMKRSQLARAFMAGSGRTVPPNIPGYTGQPFGVRVDKASLILAYCGGKDAPEGIAPEAAALYLAVCDAGKPDPHAEKFRALGIRPTPLVGHMTLNGGCMALHRRDDWLVSLVGQYAFRRANEANAAYTASAFNHYTCNGSAFVVASGNPPSPWYSGFSLEGWDSRLIPGATSYLGESEAELRNRMGQPKNAFCCGTNLDGDGVWGLELLRESNKAADNLRFHKSAFCFGDYITLITTDIDRGPNAKDAERKLEVATTLYQNAFGVGGETPPTAKGVGHFGHFPPKAAPAPPEQEPCWVDGKRITAFPFADVLPSGGVRCLVDNKGTGYYVPADAPPIRLARRQQEWNYLWKIYRKPEANDPNKRLPDPRNYTPTVGNFAVAWFEHGIKPEVGQVTYTLLPKATPERMERFAKEMASPDAALWNILQRDARAHILWDRSRQTTGYVLFQKGPVTVAGPLREVNRPCSVMVKQSDGRLRVSVASTDLDGWPGAGIVEGKGGRILLSGDLVLTLQGTWNLQGVQATVPRNCQTTHENGRTTLRIPFKDFQPVVLSLVSTEHP